MPLMPSVDDEHADDLRKAQRGDAEVVIPQAQLGHGDDEGKEHGHHAPGQHRHPEGRMQDGERPDDGIEYPHHLLLFGQQGAERAHIGPDGHEARVSQGEQPGKAVDEVEGQGQDGVDEDERQVEDRDQVAGTDGGEDLAQHRLEREAVE